MYFDMKTKPTASMEQEWEEKLNELMQLVYSHIECSKAEDFHIEIRDFIHKVREEAINETKAEQNRIVNSGRKLFQEGYKQAMEDIKKLAKKDS